MSHPPDRFRYRASEPPRSPLRPPGGLRTQRPRPRARRRLLTEARTLHTATTARVLAIDGRIEALVDQRLACLDVLVDCRDQLGTRWGTSHTRRRPGLDDAPFPEAAPTAVAVHGVQLRSVAVTILRRHGAQRLRDLHGLLHLYGYRIDSTRPVQRLADAMAYEERQGRVERLERGVYGPGEDHPGPARYEPPPAELGEPNPWDRPPTDPGPPHLDPEMAEDPELWSGGRWPEDPPPPAPPGAPSCSPSPADRDPTPDDGDAPTPPPDPTADPADPVGPAATPPTLGDDSSTNRRPAPPEQARRWEPPP